MEFKINKLTYDTISGSYVNVVNRVDSSFTYKVISSSISESVTINTILAGDSYDLQTNLNEVTSGSFISYDSLTEDNVKSWIQSSYSSSWGEFTSSIENQLSSSVSFMLSPPTVKSDIPW